MRARLLALVLGSALHAPACSERSARLTSHATALAPAAISARADKGFVAPEETLCYTLQVTHNPDIEVTVEEPKDSFGGLQVVGRTPGPERSVEGRNRRSIAYTLRAPSPGAYVLPPVVATYRRRSEAGAGAAAPKQVQTETLYVQVAADRDPPPQGLQDIKPLREPSRWRRLPLWVVGSLAALSALLLGLLLWRRFRRRKQGADAVAPPPHAVALQALQRLGQQPLHEAAALRRATFVASEVVRTYVEARFFVQATDMTTEEIFAALPDLAQLRPEPRRQLRDFLAQTDRIKYAGAVPELAQLHQSLLHAEAFVRATMPEMAVTPSPDGSGSIAVGPADGAAERR